MEKCLIITLCILLICPLPLAYANTNRRDDVQAQGKVFSTDIHIDKEGFYSSLSDWLLGTNWGILSGTLDPGRRTLTFALPKRALEELTAQDLADIYSAMLYMLSLYLPSREIAAEFLISYRTERQELLPDEAQPPDTGWVPTPVIEVDTSYIDLTLSPVKSENARENLIFIHHSVSENWLKEGVADMLNERGYHVADITYGCREYGDYTDTADLPTWFTDKVMRLVYLELGAMSADNSIGPAQGENRIILFKSCYPNSDVGDAITDEMAIYNSLLPYFQSRPTKCLSWRRRLR